jgi:hypothetical protein
VADVVAGLPQHLTGRQPYVPELGTEALVLVAREGLEDVVAGREARGVRGFRLRHEGPPVVARVKRDTARSETYADGAQSLPRELTGRERGGVGCRRDSCHAGRIIPD